jgi:hypothetical protein
MALFTFIAFYIQYLAAADPGTADSTKAGQHALRAFRSLHI